MRLVVKFRDVDGVTLAPPVIVENKDPLLAWDTALAYQRTHSERLRVRVYLTVEEG